MESIILYTTDCPKCKILEGKLNQANIKYDINNNITEMLALGFRESPMLKVGEDILSFADAVKWVNAKKLGVT